LPARATNADAVGAGVDQRDPREVSGDIGRQICVRIGDFIQQLFGGGGDSDSSTGAGHFAERCVAIGIDVGKWEPQVREAGDVLGSRIREIAAAQLAGAFQQMADGSAAGDPQVVVGTPAEVMRERRDEQRRVGDAAGDHDVGAGRERRQQRVGTDVRIGRDQRRVARQSFAGFHRDGIRIELGEHIVAGDGGNLDRQLEALRNIDDHIRCRQRIRRAEIADESRVVPLQQRQQRFDPRHEPRVVALRRITATAELCERDRALGQALENQVVEVTALGQQDRRVETIAGEARTTSESQRVGHRRAAGVASPDDHSGSMPAFLMIAFHLSDSAAWNLASSSDVVTNGSVPVDV
jgi:hypothetical protein